MRRVTVCLLVFFVVTHAFALTKDERKAYIDTIVAQIGGAKLVGLAPDNSWCGEYNYSPSMFMDDWDLYVNWETHVPMLAQHAIPWTYKKDDKLGDLFCTRYVLTDGDSYVLVVAGNDDRSEFGILWNGDDKLPPAGQPEEPKKPKDINALPEIPVQQAQLSLDGGDTLRMAAFSPDSRRIAVGGNNGRLAIIDRESQKIITSWQGHKRRNDLPCRITSLNWSQDGRMLVSTSWNGIVKVWDPAKAKALLSITLAGKKAKICDAALDPSGRILAIASLDSDDGSGLFDVTTGKQIARFATNATNTAWSSDGKYVAFATGRSDHETIDIYEVLTKAMVTQLPLPAEPADLYTDSLCFTRDGERVTALLSNDSVVTWDVKTQQPVFTITPDQVDCAAVCYTPDQKRLLLSRSGEKTIWVADAASGEFVGKMANSMNNFTSLLVSPDGTALIAQTCLLTSANGKLTDVIAAIGDAQPEQQDVKTAYLKKITALSETGKLSADQAALANAAIREDRVAEYPILKDYLAGSISEEDFLKGFKE